MPHRRKLLDAFSRLLCYPDEQTVQTAEFLYVVLQGEIPQAAGAAAEFGGFAERHELYEIEEAYTRTFDINPDCALEVGWHLFGEEYARGMFLVRMREELRKYGLPESVELPDHIAHVLAVVAAMPDAEAARFVGACVLPAVEKMQQALEKTESPYRHVVAALAAVMRLGVESQETGVESIGVAGVGAESSERSPQSMHSLGAPVGRPQPPYGGDDPLNRDFFAADFTGCGGSSCGEPEVTPLQLSFPARDRMHVPTAPEEGMPQ